MVACLLYCTAACLLYCTAACLFLITGNRAVYSSLTIYYLLVGALYLSVWLVPSPDVTLVEIM